MLPLLINPNHTCHVVCLVVAGSDAEGDGGLDSIKASHGVRVAGRKKGGGGAKGGRKAGTKRGGKKSNKSKETVDSDFDDDDEADDQDNEFIDDDNSEVRVFSLFRFFAHTECQARSGGGVRARCERCLLHVPCCLSSSH
jgi:hypothetical protein